MASRQPSLPPLPRDQLGASSSSSKRSRPRPPDLTSSSDPAVFSSDDDPALDNYTNGRRKRRYAGTWFQNERPASSLSGDFAFTDRSSPPPLREKRTMRRQFDSGVWMKAGSESNACEIHKASVVLDASSNIKPNVGGNWSIRGATPKRTCYASRTPLSAAEVNARRIIDECVQSGNQIIDISHLELDSVSNDTIGPIAEFPTVVTMVEENVPFEAKEPELQLFLFVNALTRLPPALFDIENLTVLSLRANKLRELPSSIAKLRNLRELNLAQNCLRYLPGELLKLLHGSKLKLLQLAPNPFIRLKDPVVPKLEDKPLSHDHDSIRGIVMNFRRQWTAMESAYLRGIYGEEPCYWPRAPYREGDFLLRSRLWARTPVQFTDLYGQAYSVMKIPLPSDDSAGQDVCLPAEPYNELAMPLKVKEYLGDSTVTKTTHVPSLVELALSRRLNEPVDKLEAELTARFPCSSHEGVAVPVEQLRPALQAAESGGQRCCVCGRGRFIMHKTMWLEYRNVLTLKWRAGSTPMGRGAGPLEFWEKFGEEQMVPFARKGCSWLCVPAVGAGLGPSRVDGESSSR